MYKIKKALIEASEQMTKLTGPPQIGGSSDALSIIALNLFHKDPNELFDFLNTLEHKYKSIINIKKCEAKAKETIKSLQQQQQKLKKEIDVLKKNVAKNQFKSIFSKNIKKETKELVLVLRAKEKELGSIKTTTYESILKNIINCEEYGAYTDFNKTVVSTLHGFNMFGDGIYYMNEALQKKNPYIQFTTYIVTSKTNIENIYDKSNNNLQINRYFRFNHPPVIMIHYKNSHIVLQEHKNFNERLKLEDSLEYIKPIIFKGLASLSSADLNKYIYLYDYSPLAFMTNDELKAKLPKTYNNMSYKLKLLDGTIQKLNEIEYFPYIAHFQFPSINIYFVNLATKFDNNKDMDEDGVSVAYKSIINFFVDIKERDAIAHRLWADIHTYLFTKVGWQINIDAPDIFMEKSYYVTHIPTQSFYLKFPKIKKTGLPNSIWIICDDL